MKVFGYVVAAVALLSLVVIAVAVGAVKSEADKAGYQHEFYQNQAGGSDEH